MKRLPLLVVSFRYFASHLLGLLKNIAKNHTKRMSKLIVVTFIKSAFSEVHSIILPTLLQEDCPVIFSKQFPYFLWFPWA